MTAVQQRPGEQPGQIPVGQHSRKTMEGRAESRECLIKFEGKKMKTVITASCARERKWQQKSVKKS